MAVRQRIGGPLVGNLSTMPDSRQTESRPGPSHCVQSSANSALPRRNATQTAPRPKLQIVCMGSNYTKTVWSAMRKHCRAKLISSRPLHFHAEDLPGFTFDNHLEGPAAHLDRKSTRLN